MVSVTNTTGWGRGERTVRGDNLSLPGPFAPRPRNPARRETPTTKDGQPIAYLPSQAVQTIGSIAVKDQVQRLRDAGLYLSDSVAQLLICEAGELSLLGGVDSTADGGAELMNKKEFRPNPSPVTRYSLLTFYD